MVGRPWWRPARGLTAAMRKGSRMYDSIRPGQVWLDTEGKRIQAHGGSVIAVDGRFYWYGENKERTTGADDIWHWGIRCYSSSDLYNWRDEGLIVPPELDDPASPLHPAQMMDRPHILYNNETGRFVLWAKIMGHPSYFTVYTAPAILGPYEPATRRVRPCGRDVGDFDLAVDPKTGRAYLFSQLPHTAIYTVALNEDYTDVAGVCTDHFLHVGPPEAREAPAHFMRGGKHYLITSGTTGYHPNPSEVAVAESWHGPYAVQGDLHPSDRSRTSFGSQVSSVFKVPGKSDLYIAVADRWEPWLPEQEGEEAFQSGEAFRAFSGRFTDLFNPAVDVPLTEDDKRAIKINTSVSDYVWLPIVFKGDRAEIVWRAEWRIEEFD